jgi:hypothetical protein
VARALGELAARDGRPVALISGLLANKDATGFFAPFAPLKAKVFTVTFEGHAAASAAQTAAAAELAGPAGPCLRQRRDGLDKALALEPTPHVLICGSLYLAGEVLAMSPETWPSLERAPPVSVSASSSRPTLRSVIAKPPRSKKSEIEIRPPRSKPEMLNLSARRTLGG